MARRNDPFFYEERDEKHNTAIAKGRAKDGILGPEIDTYRPGEGNHCVRFLPPRWKQATHYALLLQVHYGIGLQNKSFLCLERNDALRTPEACPLCAAGQYEKDEEKAKKWWPTKRGMAYVIDRHREHEGPLVWIMPAKAILQGAAQVKPKGCFVDHPRKGYDFEFIKSGKMLNTRYEGVAFARQATALHHTDTVAREWLEHIAAHPLPSLLVWASRQEISREIGHEQEPEAGRTHAELDEEEERMAALDTEDDIPWGADNGEDEDAAAEPVDDDDDPDDDDEGPEEVPTEDEDDDPWEEEPPDVIAQKEAALRQKVKAATAWAAKKTAKKRSTKRKSL